MTVGAAGRTGDRPGHRLRVLYVGGMPRSGSTLSDLLLHQLPGHVGVGELFYLWSNGLEHDGLCACGEPFSRCPFWTSVGARAYGGWHTVDRAEVARLQASVDRTARIPLLLVPRPPARFARDLAAYVALLEPLYHAIAAESGATTVVDSSKRPSLAYVLRRIPGIDLRVAHVVRDPRGVAYSFAKHVELPPGVDRDLEMPRSTTRKVSRRWVTVNAAVAALARVGVPLVRIRYEDLVADPGRELTRVLALEGSPAPSDVDLAFATGGAVTVPRTHLVAGGRIRLESGRMPLRLDEAWRDQMPAHARRLVELGTLPARLRYGYR